MTTGTFDAEALMKEIREATKVGMEVPYEGDPEDTTLRTIRAMPSMIEYMDRDKPEAERLATQERLKKMCQMFEIMKTFYNTMSANTVTATPS